MIPLSLRFAGRELRSGVKGFRIFLACLAVGVAAIAAAASTAEAFRQGLASEAREILGGDLSVTIGQREFTPAEHAVLARTGLTAYAAGAQAMAQAPSGQRRLVQLRGVDVSYPLAGAVQVSGAPNLRAALVTSPDGVAGAAVEPALLQRLGLLPQLAKLRLGLLQGIILHQHSLRQDVESIRVTAQPLVQELLRFRIFLGELRLLDTTDQVVEHGFFLGSHLISYWIRRPAPWP